MARVKLTIAPTVKQQVQRSQTHTGDKEMLTFYTNPAFAAKVNQLAKRNQRSLSSVLSEMLTFALDRLEDGDAELEGVAIDSASAAGASKVTLRATVAPARPQTYADVAAETLKRIPGPSDEFYDEAHRRNANALNGYGLIRDEK